MSYKLSKRTAAREVKKAAIRADALAGLDYRQLCRKHGNTGYAVNETLRELREERTMGNEHTKIPITGMIDFSCQKCGKRFGNRYTCPRCGHKIDKAELDKTMTTIHDMLRLSFVKYAEMTTEDRVIARRLSGLSLGQIERLTGLTIQEVVGFETGMYKVGEESGAAMDKALGSGNVRPTPRVKGTEGEIALG